MLKQNMINEKAFTTSVLNTEKSIQKPSACRVTGDYLRREVGLNHFQNISAVRTLQKRDASRVTGDCPTSGSQVESLPKRLPAVRTLPSERSENMRRRRENIQEAIFRPKTAMKITTHNKTSGVKSISKRHATDI